MYKKCGCGQIRKRSQIGRKLSAVHKPKDGFGMEKRLVTDDRRYIRSAIPIVYIDFRPYYLLCGNEMICVVC